MYIETIEEQQYDHYGLKVFMIDGNEYAIATSDEEADEAAGEYIQSSLWAFNASFILEHSKIGYDPDFEEMLKTYQEKKCEDANDLVENLIEDMDEFIQDAIGADGRGHFLSPYDGSEGDLDDIDSQFWGQVLGALGLGTKDKDKLILYRIN
jgi:hypothetical protein